MLTVLGSYVADVMVDGKPVWDTSEEYRLRKFSYDGSLLILFYCASHWVVKIHWRMYLKSGQLPELKELRDGVPFLLVGTNKEFLTTAEHTELSDRPSYVELEEGWFMAGKIGAWSYLECSALQL